MDRREFLAALSAAGLIAASPGDKGFAEAQDWDWDDDAWEIGRDESHLRLDSQVFVSHLHATEAGSYDMQLQADDLPLVLVMAFAAWTEKEPARVRFLRRDDSAIVELSTGDFANTYVPGPFCGVVVGADSRVPDAKPTLKVELSGPAQVAVGYKAHPFPSWVEQ